MLEMFVLVLKIVLEIVRVRLYLCFRSVCVVEMVVSFRLRGYSGWCVCFLLRDIPEYRNRWCRLN